MNRTNVQNGRFRGEFALAGIQAHKNENGGRAELPVTSVVYPKPAPQAIISNMATWITTAEAVGLSGYNIQYVRWLIREGKVAARHFGVVWQVDRKSLIDYTRKTKRGRPKKRQD
ncbi:MAG: helix-turn-helix domain-containing protein [Chloroflexi bacterium]|nr:helix-turn-helix domain-containing protein [Chloroflexota bacterium]